MVTTRVVPVGSIDDINEPEPVAVTVSYFADAKEASLANALEVSVVKEAAILASEAVALETSSPNAVERLASEAVALEVSLARFPPTSAAIEASDAVALEVSSEIVVERLASLAVALEVSVAKEAAILASEAVALVVSLEIAVSFVVVSCDIEGYKICSSSFSIVELRDNQRNDIEYVLLLIRIE